MKLHRVVIEWAGASVVGRAVTVLHYDGTEDASPPVAAIKAAFSAAAPCFPTGMSWTFPGSGDSIDDATGDLTGVWTSTGGGTVGGSGAATSAAGVGATIGWTTGGIVSGTKGPRKLRGRTFLVPITSTAFDNTGTITDPALGTLRTLADALQATGGLAVWHRPLTAGGTDGSSAAVLSNRVRDKVAFLSSRRD